MRCKSCDYPLWNLKARQCPECGLAFRPSEFEFVINSVQFCCPHCEQAYYGTGVAGHLVPQEFHCVSCGQPIAEDQMVLRPAGGVEERQTQIDRVPWLERHTLGWVKAWFKTIGWSMVAPHRLMKSLPESSPVGEAWKYAMITAAIIATCGAGLPLLVIGLFALARGGNDAWGVLGAGGGFIVGGAVLAAIIIGLWGLIIHGILRLTGGTKSTSGRTYQALLYSIGTITPMALPCVGPYCGTWFMPIWWVVSAVIMVAVGQRVHGGRATLATLVFPASLVLMTVGGYVWLIVWVMSFAGNRSTFQMPAPSNSFAELRTLTSQLNSYTAMNNGSYPDHAAQLIMDNSGPWEVFVSVDAYTTAADIPLADMTLDQALALPPEQQQAVIDAAANALPTNVVAHRVGDYVFTYHGIDSDDAATSLWIVILSPDPDVSQFTATSPVLVGCADGRCRPLTTTLAEELVSQNALRAKHGLPPLPDPATVTHARPAVAD